MRAIPVAQPYDAALPPDKQRTPAERRELNEVMFSTVQQRLTEEGINVVIFPEGTCHSTPQVLVTRKRILKQWYNKEANGCT